MYSTIFFFLNIKFISWSFKITVEFGGGGGQTQGKQKRRRVNLIPTIMEILIRKGAGGTRKA